MRLWLILGWIAYLVFSSILTTSTSAQETERPNLVLVFIDDMGWGDFSCFGNETVETENIDRLARAGIRFRQFYVNSPICSPSRTAITTGNWPQRWRIGSYLDNRQRNADRGIANWLDPQAPSLARILKQQGGYRTGHFGKWHMGGQRDVGDAPLILEYGFDQSLTNFEGLGDRIIAMKDFYDGRPARPHDMGSIQLGRGKITYMPRDQVTAGFVDGAIQFIDQSQKEGRPFYINLWPDDVHSPFFPPEGQRGDGKKRTLYRAVLDTMDQQLGKLFDRIQQDPKLKDNTLILICSDNGPEKGAGSPGPFRPYEGGKTMLFEGGIRSSLIVWGPALQNEEMAGKENRDSVFSAIDLVPSLLNIAGVEVPTGVDFDGQPLPQVLLGHSQDSRSAPLFFRRPPDRDRFDGIQDLPDLAIRDGDWKLLCEYDGSKAQLFNLKEDPSEKTNLVAQETEIVARLQATLLKWHQAMPADKGATWQPR